MMIRLRFCRQSDDAIDEMHRRMARRSAARNAPYSDVREVTVRGFWREPALAVETPASRRMLDTSGGR